MCCQVACLICAQLGSCPQIVSEPPVRGIDRYTLEKGRSPQGWAGVCLWFGEVILGRPFWTGGGGSRLIGCGSLVPASFGFVRCLGWHALALPRVVSCPPDAQRGASVSGPLWLSPAVLLLFIPRPTSRQTRAAERTGVGTRPAAPMPPRDRA